MRHFISKLILIMVIPSMSSCMNSRFIRKELKYSDIEINWYYYSYISNNSPDIIEVSKGKESKVIFKGDGVVTDVSLINDTIRIQLFRPSIGIIYEDFTNEKIFGYNAIIDTTANLDDFKKIPDGKKE
jgi:hypothetical protein